jgi:ribose transport system permease protein
LTGVGVLLIVLFSLLGFSGGAAFDRSNIYEVLSRHGALGVITLGAALLIVVGGIDLSIGSVVGLSAVTFGVLMESGIDLSGTIFGYRYVILTTSPISPIPAMLIATGMGTIIGFIQGLLVTRLRLQAFLVTLCGMFIYRGVARQVTAKNTGLVGVRELHPEFGSTLDFLRFWLVGKAENGALVFPAQLVVCLVLATILGVILHRTVFGRYWYAIGYNEQAARYAGVKVERQKLAVFVICSTLAAFAGVLLLLFSGSANPSDAGTSLELYAITAAVLGGCSLRGGEGLMIGFVLGALVQPVINNLMIFRNIPSSAEPWVMGLILLIGTIADEMIRRRSRLSR